MLTSLSQPGLRTLHEAGPELKRAISGNLDEMRDDDIPTHRVRQPSCPFLLKLSWHCWCVSWLWGIAKSYYGMMDETFAIFLFSFDLFSLTDLFLSLVDSHRVYNG